MNKTLLFLIIGFAFFWLVLDQIYGNKYISQFVTAIIPAASDVEKTSGVENI